jgi:Holliday junction resolvase
MTEQQLQSKIIKKLKLNGFFVTKLIKTSTNGIPDLLAIKDGKATFIEVKRPDGILSELQKLRIKELQRFGCEVKIWTDYEREFH